MTRQTASVLPGISATADRSIHNEDSISMPMEVHTTIFTSLSDENNDIDRTDIAISPVINEHGISESKLAPLTALMNTCKITAMSTYSAIFILPSSGCTVFLLLRNCFTARKIKMTDITEVKKIFIKSFFKFVTDLTKV